MKCFWCGEIITSRLRGVDMCQDCFEHIARVHTRHKLESDLYSFVLALENEVNQRMENDEYFDELLDDEIDTIDERAMTSGTFIMGFDNGTSN